MQKYPSTPSLHRRPLPPGSRREPCATLPEIAERLGTTRFALAGLLSHYPEHAPRPGIVCHQTMNANRRAYYRMSDFRRWIAHHNLELKQ